MTSQWDTFSWAWNQLAEKDVPQGRKNDIYESIRTLIEALHDLDHATHHKSTDDLFKSKGLQSKLKLLNCDHYKDSSKWEPVRDKEEAERGMMECYYCGSQMHKDVIKDHYGYEVKQS